MLYGACFLAAFGLFVAGASPTVSFEDTGELAWASVCLGVTHPPGYPWLTMLGSLFGHLPAGDFAFRLNIMSAVFGAASVTAACAGARLIALHARLPGWPAGIAAALSLAASRTLWWQAGIGEKYTASLMLMAFAVLAMLKIWLARRPEALSRAAFLAGLALSHHLHGLYLVPTFLLLVWRMKIPRKRILILLLLMILPGFAKLAVIPIRSAANPELNWAAPARLHRLAVYVSARQYRRMMFAGSGPLDLAKRTLTQTSVLPLREFGPVLALAAPGLSVLRGIPGLMAGAAAIWGVNVILALSYNTPEIERYYLLSFFLFAGLIGVGAARLLRDGPALAPALILMLLIPFAFNGRTSPRNRHYLAYDFAVNQLAPLPPGAVLICEGDDQAFPLFYLREVLGYRDDMILMPMPFACERNGYEHLQYRLDNFIFPEFDANPGRHLPRIITANSPARPAFYTPGCTGERSEAHLVPFGITFEVFTDPEQTDRAMRKPRRFPRLRLRGCVNAASYADPVTIRAVGNYGFSLAYRGAGALQSGKLDSAEYFLKSALRLPLQEGIRAAATTHLGMTFERQGRLEEAESAFRLAIELKDDFGPALLAYGRYLAVHHPGHPETRALLFEAMRHPEFLTNEERLEVRRLLSRPP